jgi:hypothetical protein
VNYEFPPELRQLIELHMASGMYESEDALLTSALASLGDCDDGDLEAIRAGVESYQRGTPGVPLDEAFARLRAKHGIDNQA